MKVKVIVAQLCLTLCSPVACLAPLSMEFSRQEYWSRLPFASPWDLPDPGFKPGSLALQADFLPSEPPGNSTYESNQYSAHCRFSKMCIFSVIPCLLRHHAAWNVGLLRYDGESQREREKLPFLLQPLPWSVAQSWALRMLPLQICACPPLGSGLSVSSARTCTPG